MKKIVFFIIFAALFVACDNKPEMKSDSKQEFEIVLDSPQDSALHIDLTQIRIKEQPEEKLEYIGKIGDDFDAALDSLKELKNITSEIIKEPLEVLFDYDNRLFFGIIYDECGNYSDVLDTKGNYYLRTWYY